MQKSRWLFALAVTVVFGGAGIAQETATFSYDALGRLTGSSISGGPNAGRATGGCFDPAGNRTRYDVATATPAPCPTATPTPVPTPTP
jgi:uncharacterized protein involved in exopolysaccharide biosynthesis